MMDDASFSANHEDYGYDGYLQTLLDEEFSRLRGIHSHHHAITHINLHQDTTYLDHAGTTMYGEKQLQNVMMNLMGNTYGNPHILK